MASYQDPTVAAIQQEPVGRPGPVAWAMLAVGVLSLVVLGFFAVKWQVTVAQNKQAAQQLAADKASRDQLSSVADQLTRFSAVANGLHQVFDHQQRWEDVLTTLQGHLYKKMSVSSLQLSDDGTLVISGTVSDYTQYAKVYSSFISPTAQKYFGAARPLSVSKVAVTSPGQKSDANAPTVVNFSFQGKLDLTHKPAGGTQ